jgi:hypothetical protein
MEKQTGISTNLSATSNLSVKIIEAKYTKKIKDLQANEAFEKIKEAVRYWHATLGLSPTNAVSEYTMAVIQEFFVNHMNYISVEEIRLAVFCAIEKKFECDLTLYNKTFSAEFMAGIIKKYLDYRNSLKDTKIVANQKQLATKTQPTNLEIAQMNDKFYIESFETFCKEGWFEDSGNCLYNLLVDANKISHTTHLKYMSEAKILIEGKYSQNKAKNGLERLKFKGLLSDLENNLGTELEIAQKKICLNKFFEARKEKLTIK